MLKFNLLLFGIIPGFCVFTQSLYTDAGIENSVYLHYENDVFAGTDRYYTQGFHLGITQFAGNSIYRFQIGQDVFTPSTIKSDSLLRNDRPYAATLTLKIERTFIKNDHEKLLLGIETGLIGPPAGGKQMQTGIHKATNNFLPLGWQHQINTGLIFDIYGLGEIRILNLDSVFQLFGGIHLRAGSYKNTLTPMLRMDFGKRLGRISGYWQNALAGVVYDGSLQGALIARESEFVLSSSEIRHFVYQSEWGIIFHLNKIGLTINYCLQTKTFDDQLDDCHSWCGLKLSYGY